MKQKHQITRNRILRYCVYAVLTILFAMLLVLQWDNLLSALRSAVQADLKWLVIGTTAMGISVVLTSIIYTCLSPRHLPFGRLLLVQTAGLFANKLLPSGSGAAGISYLFLRSNHVSKSQSVAVVATNNLIGFLGHVLLLIGMISIVPGQLDVPPGLNDHLSPSPMPALVAGAIVVILAGILSVMYKAKLTEILRHIRSALSFLWRPRSLVALPVSMLLTASYLLSLACACLAVGLTLSPLLLLLVLTFSVGATSIVPTPGGIGAAEAGVYVVLRAYGIETSTALSVAILYRLMTFWLPLLVGAFAALFVSRNRYVL